MSAAQHSAPPSAIANLALEAAVAARVLRTARLPTGLLQWLTHPASARLGPAADIQYLCDAQLTAVLNEIIGPLSTRPPKSQQRQARFAAQWLAVACRHCTERSSRLQLSIGPRLLAASLLPLYRCLATGDLCEGLRQTQMRLAESLSLLALCDEIGPALVDVLGTQSTTNSPASPSVSPDEVLCRQFSLRLPFIAQLLSELDADFDLTVGKFTSAACDRLQSFDASQAHSDTPAWAAPELLWKLAGELTSENLELKLPRSWIDTPLPWNQIVDHWHRMRLLLSNQPLSNPVPSNQADSVDEESALTAVHEIAALIPSNGPVPGNRPARGSEHVPSSVSDSVPATSASATSSHATQGHSETQSHSPASGSSHQPTSAVRAWTPPRVLISEILTHSDPSFVNVIRRQIGKCRAEDRALSLVSLVVLPEDANHRFAVYDNGLNLWQQKLVGWLSDHPQVIEPHAFLTSDSELLLCILDLERNETTALLRHGLIEVLTGRRFDHSQGNLLAEVDAPARYHAGIASASSPGARFLPEQLIDPAIRCLSAARRHGKASIKSIEVY